MSNNMGVGSRCCNISVACHLDIFLGVVPCAAHVVQEESHHDAANGAKHEVPRQHLYAWKMTGARMKNQHVTKETQDEGVGVDHLCGYHP